MSGTQRRLACLALGGLLALSLACGPSDPRMEILEERTRWTIAPKSVVEGEDGSVRLSVSVSGPARSDLERLTFRVRLANAEGETVSEEWKSVDLTQVPMGTATDFSFRLDSGGLSFEEIDVSLDPVLAPTPEEESKIRELQL